MRLLPPLAVRRVAFLGFALAVAISTHWPRLDLGDSEARPDLFIHVAAFAAWTGLLVFAAFFGPAASTRNLAVSAVVAAAYAGLDEWSQRFFDRSSSLDDFLANLGGVVVGVAIAGPLARVFERVEVGQGEGKEGG